MKAEEEIYLPEYWNSPIPIATEFNDKYSVKYIRADVAEAKNKELRKFVRHEETCATRVHLFGTHNCDCELAKLLEK
jgi:hypothetical protein